MKTKLTKLQRKRLNDIAREKRQAKSALYRPTNPAHNAPKLFKPRKETPPILYP